MNAHAGVRNGRCQTRGCPCAAYAWRIDWLLAAQLPPLPVCDCSHPQRSHAQVPRPLVTYRGWGPEAA